MYVDDIIITEFCDTVIPSIISFLGSHFVVKDMGELIYFLGIEVFRCRDGLFLQTEVYFRSPGSS